MVGIGCLARFARVLVEELHQSLIRIMVQVMQLISSSKQVGDSLWRGLVDDSRRDDIGHVSVIIGDWDLKLGVRIESTNGCQVNVTAENGDSDGKLGCKGLELMNQEESLLLVGASCVMIIKVVK